MFKHEFGNYVQASFKKDKLKTTRSSGHNGHLAAKIKATSGVGLGGLEACYI